MTRRGRAIGVLALAALGSAGCTVAPKRFRDLINPAPLVRARAVGLGRELPDTVVVPALIDRLDDPDAVVRLSAHEELKTRTGKDFGYEPWAEPTDRVSAVGRWRSWWAAQPRPPQHEPRRPPRRR